jgi:hypothetical protein
MDEKTPITLDAATAAALAEMVYTIGGLQEQILGVLGRARLEAIETQVRATLDGRRSISRTGEDYLGEVIAMLAVSHQNMAYARLPVARPSVPEESAAGLVTPLADVFAAITDPATVALSKMIALDVFAGALNMDVSRSIAPTKRKEVKGQASALAADALDQPIGLSMNLTVLVIDRIVASLETVKTQIGVDGQEIELAATVHFVRSLSSGCRRKCSARVGQAIVFDVKNAAAAAFTEWSTETSGDDRAYRLKTVEEILLLAGDVGEYLRGISVPQPA